MILPSQNNQTMFGDPEWSHPAFINFPQSISSQAISTISYVRDYVRVIPLTIDATPLNYNTFLPGHAK